MSPHTIGATLPQADSAQDSPEPPPTLLPTRTDPTAKQVPWGYWARRIAGLTALAVLSLLACLAVWATLPALALGWNAAVVTGGSMAPAINAGDVVLIQQRPADDLRPGTIVMFDDPAGTGNTLHRVVERREDGRLVTKGDGNALPDSTPVEIDRVQGAARLVVPVVGRPFVWVSEEDWTTIGIATLGLAVALWCTRWAFAEMPLSGVKTRGFWLEETEPTGERPSLSPIPAAAASFVALAQVPSDPEVLELGLWLELRQGLNDVALTLVDLPNAWFTFDATDEALEEVLDGNAQIDVWREADSPHASNSGRGWGTAASAAAVAAIIVVGSVLSNGDSTAASWTSATGSTANSIAADTLQPPTGANGATARIAGAVDLGWTATPDTYATGYRLLRATVSGGPYSPLTDVTPSAAIAHQDTALTPGTTYYYILRSYFQQWESVDSNEASALATNCTAGDTGYLDPTSDVADTGGGNDGFEVNPTGAYADGGGYAEDINDIGDRHRFYDFGIVLPLDCNTVEGIEVRLDWWMDLIPPGNSIAVELSWDGGTSWTAAQIDADDSQSEKTVELGGPLDTWGHTWTGAELGDANFRMRIVTDQSTPIRDFFLDWAAVKVYYAP